MHASIVVAVPGHGGRDLGQTGGDVDVICEFVGTGGTFGGMARFLKSQAPRSPATSSGPLGRRPCQRAAHRAGYRIQGGGYSMPSLPLLDRALVDGFIQAPTPARSSAPDG